jgi:hypothetical protein
MYLTYEEYAAIYDAMPAKDFDRLNFEACRHIDRLTAGVDGVKKLKVAFPTDEDSSAAVKHCAAHIVNILYQIQEAEKSASLGRGFTETENGLHGKVVSSVTAGNESISYAVGNSAKTSIDKAVSDRNERIKLLRETVREYLSGVTDANGVNLLYMGVYPYVV